MVDAQLFVNIAKTVFGGYSAMMLLMPKKMVTDHFKQECDPSAIRMRLNPHSPRICPFPDR